MKTDDLKAAIHAQPMLLATSQPRLGLLWSAKAGCTFAVKWFLSQAGLLPAATFFHAWIHQYRNQVFYASEGFALALAQPDFLDFPFVKFVRDPYARCVSAYLAFCHVTHTQRNGEHGEFLSLIERSVGRQLGAQRTFTFREFVAFLGKLNLDCCDIHVRRQTHPLERLAALRNLHVVQLERSECELPAIERMLGLPSTDLASLRRSPHHATKAEYPGIHADTSFFNTVNHPTPAARSFYDDALRTAVAQLYAEDFSRYGYEKWRPG
ncbi:MAG: sulfotransferase family 2 domain-containing protein [Rudaea sp.]